MPCALIGSLKYAASPTSAQPGPADRRTKPWTPAQPCWRRLARGALEPADEPGGREPEDGVERVAWRPHRPQRAHPLGCGADEDAAEPVVGRDDAGGGAVGVRPLVARLGRVPVVGVLDGGRPVGPASGRGRADLAGHRPRRCRPRRSTRPAERSRVPAPSPDPDPGHAARVVAEHVGDPGLVQDLARRPRRRRPPAPGRAGSGGGVERVDAGARADRDLHGVLVARSGRSRPGPAACPPR